MEQVVERGKQDLESLKKWIGERETATDYVTIPSVHRLAATLDRDDPFHYDLPYVTQVEGYPGLIVNGGLSTLFIFELARQNARSPIVRFPSRNVRPLFVNRPLHVCGAPSSDNKTAKLWVTDHEGALALIADAEFA